MPLLATFCQPGEALCRILAVAEDTDSTHLVKVEIDHIRILLPCRMGQADNAQKEGVDDEIRRDL